MSARCLHTIRQAFAFEEAEKAQRQRVRLADLSGLRGATLHSTELYREHRRYNAASGSGQEEARCPLIIAPGMVWGS